MTPANQGDTVNNRSYVVILAIVVALIAASGASAKAQLVHTYKLAPAKAMKHYGPDVRAARRSYRFV